jgi:hypothetical protein
LQRGLNEFNNNNNAGYGCIPWLRYHRNKEDVAMLKTLRLKNFTAFTSANLSFCPGLNVIVGQNGTGKTHILKAAYLLNRAWPDLMLKRSALNRKRAEAYFEERLLGLFQPIRLDNLIRRGSRGGCLIAGEVEAFIQTISILTKEERLLHLNQFPFGSNIETLHWELAIKPAKEISLVDTNARLDASLVPDTAAVNAYVSKSLFIPSKEIVSFYEGLSALLKRYEIRLDATYGDLADLMSGPELSEVPWLASGMLRELESELGGRLRLESGRLVFVGVDGNQTEAPLMAEGLRKIAALIYLIRLGCITQKGETLFWDEPEANLNPAFIRRVAQILVWLARSGLQVIVATHSLFLLREFEVLAREKRADLPPLAAKYFALGLTKKGVSVSSGDSIDACDPLILLDEDLAQSDRFMETLR